MRNKTKSATNKHEISRNIFLIIFHVLSCLFVAKFSYGMLTPESLMMSVTVKSPSASEGRNGVNGVAVLR